MRSGWGGNNNENMIWIGEDTGWYRYKEVELCDGESDEIRGKNEIMRYDDGKVAVVCDSISWEKSTLAGIIIRKCAGEISGRPNWRRLDVGKELVKWVTEAFGVEINNGDFFTDDAKNEFINAITTTERGHYVECDSVRMRSLYDGIYRLMDSLCERSIRWVAKDRRYKVRDRML